MDDQACAQIRRLYCRLEGNLHFKSAGLIIGGKFVSAIFHVQMIILWHY